jgi:UDP-N-acetylmuramyl pentapeptide phosphotransferase/UDP-N-acetylglucosamine-1-phosphate transferase
MLDHIIVFIIPFLSFVITTLVFPKVLRFARKHHIVDSPNARKLQRYPTPVLGGVAVYLGILIGYLVLASYQSSPVILWSLVAMTIMQIIGIWDDISDLSTMFRFLFEIVLVGVLIGVTGIYIDSFYGFWGFYQLNSIVAVTLSIVAGVGIINAVNMIDGVDGYVSGYCMQACLCFAVLFWVVKEPMMLCMTLVVAASLLPFFFHNVFGVKSKMFIGDGGTMMLGVLMAIFALFTLSSKSKCGMLATHNVSLIAFSLAVMCIPVFDTLRVMTLRILRGFSPFQSDKTHLHHLFIDMGFSHLGAALSILLINLSVVLIWFALWKFGVSIEWQTYIVALMGMTVTFGFYKLMKIQQFGGNTDENGRPQGTALWHFFLRMGEWSHREKGRVWRTIRWLMDSRWLG